MQLVYAMLINNNHALFHLWWKGTFGKTLITLLKTDMLHFTCGERGNLEKNDSLKIFWKSLSENFSFPCYVFC